MLLVMLDYCESFGVFRVRWGLVPASHQYKRLSDIDSVFYCFGLFPIDIQLYSHLKLFLL